MYASSWFLTLFTTQLPLHIVCRAIDLFLSEVDYSIYETKLKYLTFVNFFLYMHIGYGSDLSY
jgi:hypothetical protein